MIPMRPSPKSLTGRPINSAAEPHGRTAAASLEQNDPGATNGPEIGSRATGSAPDRTSQVSDRLAVLAETQRRLMTLAAEFETSGTIAPPSGPKIKPGSRLVRERHGRTHTVCVTDDGFEFQGKSYRSLTKVALDITGAQWSGPQFFALTKRSTTATATPDNLSTGEEMHSENPNG